MHLSLARVRTAVFRRPSGSSASAIDMEGQACSWDALRAVYQEQAARGVPEAIRGLELIEQDRWPTSGRLRKR